MWTDGDDDAEDIDVDVDRASDMKVYETAPQHLASAEDGAVLASCCMLCVYNHTGSCSFLSPISNNWLLTSENENSMPA